MNAGENGAQFVAVEVMFWDHPQTQTLAAALGEDLLTAGARILVLRQHVLLFGTYEGRLTSSADEIAMVCRWPKSPKLLIAALVKARVLKGAKNRWQYIDWPRTRTGYYQSKRAADAERKRAEREARMKGREADGPPVSHETSDLASVDSPRTVHGESVRKKERKESADADGPPEAPQGGDALADWEWFRNAYPNPRNYTKSKDRFLSFDQETRDRIRFYLDTYMSRRTRAKWKFMDLFLRSGEWDQIDAKRHVEKPEKNAKSPDELLKEAEENERMKRIMERRFELKRELKAKGLRGDELQRRVDELMEREELQVFAPVIPIDERAR